MSNKRMQRTSNRAVSAVSKLTLAGLAMLSSAEALAAPATTGYDYAPRSRPARLIMGLKAGGGGSLYDTPKDVPQRCKQGVSGCQALLPIFEETRAGYALSTGFFLQGLFFDHFALDVGFHFVQHKLFETIDWTHTGITTISTAQSDTEVGWTMVHVPVLVKAVLPTGNGTRISLGVGPEFAFGVWEKSKFKINRSDETEGGKLVLPGEDRKGFKNVFVKGEDSVYFTVNFGIEIELGDFLVPIDLHWSYNLSQPRNYLDRTILEPGDLPSPSKPYPSPTEITIRGRDTMYGGLRVGLAYQF